jgi:hypothetical protein
MSTILLHKHHHIGLPPIDIDCSSLFVNPVQLHHYRKIFGNEDHEAFLTDDEISAMKIDRYSHSSDLPIFKNCYFEVCLSPLQRHPEFSHPNGYHSLYFVRAKRADIDASYFLDESFSIYDKCWKSLKIATILASVPILYAAINYFKQSSSNQ